MINKKILLAFDGSTQALNAAELCWQLAAKYPVRLTAQHVVNTVGLWQLLNFELPGLTGSGPYIAAHENMGKELRSIGETLVAIYETKARSRGLADECVMDEGDAISEVARRAAVHDLVVIGHHPSTAGLAGGAGLEKSFQLPRYLTHFSMAESLAKILNKPLLVVQAPAHDWNCVHLILHGSKGSREIFQAAADMAAFLQIPLKVDSYFVGSPSEGNVVDLAPLVKETEKLYPALDVTTHTARLWPLDESGKKFSTMCDENSLVMIPTFWEKTERRSAFSTDIGLLVRHSEVPALLLYPVGNCENVSAGELQTAASSL